MQICALHIRQSCWPSCLGIFIYVNCEVNDYTLHLRWTWNHMRRFASIGELAIAPSSINTRVIVIWGDVMARWNLLFPAMLPSYGSPHWNSSSSCCCCCCFCFSPLPGIFLRLSWQHQQERKHIRQLRIYFIIYTRKKANQTVALIQSYLIPKSVSQHSWPCHDTTRNIISETLFRSYLLVSVSYIFILLHINELLLII